MPFAATWMNLESVRLSEVSQTEEEKYPYDITYTRNPKRNYRTELTKQRDSQTWKTSLGFWGQGGIVWDFGKARHTLLYLEWTSGKDLPYAQGTQLLSPGSLGGRGVWGRADTCVCLAEPLCSPETITMLLTGYTPVQKLFGV